MTPEAWLRGPVDGVPDLLQPIAHALLQAREEARSVMQDFPPHLLWQRPAGLAEIDAQVDRALNHLRATNPHTLSDARAVGRKQLPSTVMGLLFHAAEHVQRHVGQLLVTVRVVAESRK
jgi:hypothetical protein